jgi:hypothetical protein
MTRCSSASDPSMRSRSPASIKSAVIQSRIMAAALSLFEQLPPDVAKSAAGEFLRLLETGFVRDTSAIFIGPGCRNRNVLLSLLQRIPAVIREAFARTVYDEGFEVDVPGVWRPDSRPCR